MSQLKRISIGAAATAIVVETGARNLMLWTLVTLGTPATTVAFVYEVVQMRQTSLRREASDRAAVATGQSGSTSDAGGRIQHAPPADADLDLRHRLTSMLIAHAHFVDIYGDNPESVSPADKKAALGMLVDDERMFARLQAEKRKDLDNYLFDLQQDEARLRVLHVQLAALASDAPAPARGAFK
jgi:hypothetical protein